jgi:hypothetical protein
MDRMRSIQDDPRKVALGYAFGIFLATTPFIGLKVLIAIIITHVFKWNKKASVIGALHVNGLNGAAYYGFVYFIGKQLIPSKVDFVIQDKINFQTFLSFFIGSWEVFLVMLVGGLVIGIPLSLLAYKLVYKVLSHKNVMLKYDGVKKDVLGVV